MVTSDGKSRGWIWERQESDFPLWQALFLEQLKILRAKFRLLGEPKRFPGEKKRKGDLVLFTQVLWVREHIRMLISSFTE